MMENKQRSDVRRETDRGARYSGYALISVGIISAVVFALAPIFGKEPSGPWYLSTLFVAVGIPLAFPRSGIGHAIIGRFDKLLDRFIGNGKSDA